ncbi:glycerol-3-phosphate responsive antiterminator [Sporofaciens musculi]|jgi:glycerol uptake operon antiterminator|uniref:glycerol-3-phosphate responsive antiterminator n=1 Tax=Sporofaciens musculi TaxID=2681861 RepID=UPI00257045A6|nr:glycerol-3-phosphate responsive antiterminator [Sporofaciens musculi]
MDRKYYEAIESNPVVAAVKDMEGLLKCCELEDIRVVFILFGDICTIRDIVNKVKDTGRMAMVHIDLITGLGSKEVAVDYIKQYTEADGIITTKPALIRRGRELSLCTVLRYFLIDSMALENIRNQQHTVKPDFIEVLPGLMPKVIGQLCQISRTPIIAGGLLNDKEDVMNVLSAGVIAVSSTNQDVWQM